MSKDATASFKYGGEVGDLLDATRRACDNMSLRRKSEKSDSHGFTIEAREKMRWLTTNWPVSFSISAQPSGDDWAVIVTAGSKMFSLTQDTNNRAKARELASMIESLAPQA